MLNYRISRKKNCAQNIEDIIDGELYKKHFEDYFDTSNFSKHLSGIPVGENKKVPGMMKDEAGGKIIEEFVGLRAKLYSYKMLEGKEEKNAKE